MSSLSVYNSFFLDLTYGFCFWEFSELFVQTQVECVTPQKDSPDNFLVLNNLKFNYSALVSVNYFLYFEFP